MYSQTFYKNSPGKFEKKSQSIHYVLSEQNNVLFIFRGKQ